MIGPRDKDRRQDVGDCLQDIQTSAAAIARYIDGLSESQFLAEQEKQDAVMYRIEMIGAAASRLTKADPEYGPRFSNLPVEKIIGLGNVIAHEYDSVDTKMVWNTARTDVPTLHHEVSCILEAQQLGKTLDGV